MTQQDRLDVLKALRDEVKPLPTSSGLYTTSARTATQIAALDYIIEREESLANAEGHAAVLRETEVTVESADLIEPYLLATLAGALALLENPTLKAELTIARTALAEKEAENTRLRARLKDAEDELREGNRGLSWEEATGFARAGKGV